MFSVILDSSGIVIKSSKLVTDAVKQGWDITWKEAFEGPLFKILAQLGLTFAVCTLLIWIIAFFNNLVNDRNYNNFSEIIWPIVVILLLLNGGKNLADITVGLRGVINGVNREFLASTLKQADINSTLDALSNYSDISVYLKTQASQCYSQKIEPQEVCLDRVLAQATEIRNAYDASLLDQGRALLGRLDRQIESIKKDPAKAALGVALLNANSIGLLIAETIMLASLAAFQQLIEVSMLLTGLLGTIAVGTSLLPVGAKPLYAWLTAFWSLGIAKLSLNIIVSLVSLSVTSSAENIGLTNAILLGILSPILALGLASAGGIAIFNAIVGAVSAASSTAVSIAKSSNAPSK